MHKGMKLEHVDPIDKLQDEYVLIQQQSANIYLIFSSRMCDTLYSKDVHFKNAWTTYL